MIESEPKLVVKGVSNGCKFIHTKDGETFYHKEDKTAYTGDEVAEVDDLLRGAYREMETSFKERSERLSFMQEIAQEKFKKLLEEHLGKVEYAS